MVHSSAPLPICSLRFVFVVEGLISWFPAPVTYGPASLADMGTAFGTTSQSKLFLPQAAFDHSALPWQQKHN